MFTLLKSVREYKWVSIITPILKIAEVIMEVLIPLYMADLIDYGIDKGDMDYVWKMGLILVGFTILSFTFGVVEVLQCQRRQQASLKTCVRICSTKCRIIPFLILTSFQPQV